MAAIDQNSTFGRARTSFADERDIDEFVDMLSRYERGEVSAEDWRKFRLVRGTYGQRQPGAIHMLRIKAPQGIVTGPQLRAMADVATKYSRGFGHITTRQNVQFHFVPLEQAEIAMRELAASGMTTREACGNSVRNITSCPYAGVAHDEVFDVTPYSEIMTRYFLRHPLAGILPRKFKIAFEGCPVDHALAAIHDLGWRARIVDGQRGFRLNIAGGTSIMTVSGYLLYDFLPVEQMLEVAEAIVRVYHRFGDYKHRSRNRMKFMIKALGWETWRGHFEEALAQVRAEGGRPLPFDPALQPVEMAPDWAQPAPPSVQAVAEAARTPVIGPGIVPGTVVIKTLSDAYVRWQRYNVAPQKQDGYVYVTVRLPLGDFTSGQMRVLADLAESFSDGTARLTIGQNVVFRWVKSDRIEALYQRLVAANLGASDANTLADLVSCPGAESCKLAVTQSRGLGVLLTEHLSARPDLVDLVPQGDIKMSGCPNGCGQHHIASIGFQGSVRKVDGRALPQYFVLVGGGTSEAGAHFGTVVSKVPVQRLPAAVERLLDLYRERREHAAEPLDVFFRRLPAAVATEALRDLADVQPGTATERDFIDLGEDRAFAPEVMEGECAS